MRWIYFSGSLLVTVLLVLLLGTRMVLPAPLGALLSPQQGIWQNAEPADISYNDDLTIPGLDGKSTVYFDERLVPHVFAVNDHDAYFIQGYLHAKFRLWQMEFETHAAGGRLAEILGAKAGSLDVVNSVDRYFRRIGMVWAAEKSLALMEADTATKMMCDAYTAGVNAYIGTLSASNLPLEYKLLGYAPEPWTNLKTALFIKYMAFDLAGHDNDFEFTAAKNALTKIAYQTLYPIRPDSIDPIIPGSAWDPPALHPVAPATADSLYFTYKQDSSTVPVEPVKPDRRNGSNNWAVSGSKTRSGYPILCNDPHLGLNLPSLWYEMQIRTPNFNAYGVSFPAAPGIIIGFNDSCAFGVTNAGRDVKDYYSIRFKDARRSSYWFNGEWKSTDFRAEHIKIKNGAEVIDTVAYTVFGPVVFDDQYRGSSAAGTAYAVRWKAHDASNEMKMFYLLDRARNYNEYLAAIGNLHTPGQNCVFAAKNGDIAMWCQGEFPAKWKGQGDFVMPGIDSSYMWQGMIPQTENPHQINPSRGFVSSANQYPADSSYPYYIGDAIFPNYRGWTINQRLSHMADITPEDMMELQTSNYNLFAAMARPMLQHYMNADALSPDEKKYWQIFNDWNLRSDTGEAGPVVFDIFWRNLEHEIISDEAASFKGSFVNNEQAMLEGLLRDSSWRFIDNINTPQKETLPEVLMAAFKKSVPSLKKTEQEHRLSWAVYKDTHVMHLTKLPGLSRLHLNIGGGRNIINATGPDHGPSWRMVVSMTPETEAWAVYPGGQNGNPGSRHYDDFVDQWANGKYYPLWIMKASDTNNKHIRHRIQFNNQ
jgi:penicillin amidase